MRVVLPHSDYVSFQPHLGPLQEKLVPVLPLCCLCLLLKCILNSFGLLFVLGHLQPVVLVVDCAEGVWWSMGVCRGACGGE